MIRPDVIFLEENGDGLEAPVEKRRPAMANEDQQAGGGARRL